MTRSNFCTSERRLTLCLGGHPSELDSNSCWLITVAPDELAAARSCRPVGRAPLDGPDSCTHTESHFKPCRHVSLSPVFRAKNRHDAGTQSAAVVSFPIQKLISNRKSFALGSFFFPRWSWPFRGGRLYLKSRKKDSNSSRSSFCAHPFSKNLRPTHF